MTIDERIATELRRHAPQVDEPEAWDRIRSAVPARRRGRTLRLVSVSVAAVGFVLLGFVLLPNLSSGAPPASDPQTPFADTWVSVDSDGSTPTMLIEVSEDGTVEMLVHDDHASVCSGASSTMTGTGRLEGTTTLVFPSPVLTCGDGSQPQPPSGTPLEEQLRDLTFVLNLESDTLTDSSGSVWTREGAEDPDPEPTVSTDMWPQTNLEEVREAQERADAGDPDYTWQLDETLAANGEPWGAEIFARFLEEELGWEAWEDGSDFGGYAFGDGGGLYREVVFIRCAPGQTNPLNPLYPEALPEIRRCAPTIDQLTYETVMLGVTQPGRKGPDGLWVVDEWVLLQPDVPLSLWDLLSPEWMRQVEQVVPPSDAEISGLLEAFLGARVDGEGAEKYLLREPEAEESIFEDVPLLYATTSGALYERYEIEKVEGPVWPTGRTLYKVRLFAEDGSLVEQQFHVVRYDGQVGLAYGYVVATGVVLGGLPTTENGRSVPVPYSINGGEVTFAAAPPWYETNRGNPEIPDTFMRFNGSRDDHVVIATDHPVPVLPGCERFSAPADAEALARMIMADPNGETTGAVPVRIAGIDGLQLDVDVDDVAMNGPDDFCWTMWVPDQAPGWRMRLYLIDYPGPSAQILTIAVIAAPETDFERVLEEATPIVESLEIHAN